MNSRTKNLFFIVSILLSISCNFQSANVRGVKHEIFLKEKTKYLTEHAKNLEIENLTKKEWVAIEVFYNIFRLERLYKIERKKLKKQQHRNKKIIIRNNSSKKSSTRILHYNYKRPKIHSIKKKKYRCNLLDEFGIKCRKVSKTRGNLEKHQLSSIHNVSKTYHCKYCTDKFWVEDQIRTHLKKTHKNYLKSNKSRVNIDFIKVYSSYNFKK